MVHQKTHKEEINMRKKKESSHVEVKATVTEVLGTKTDLIYDGGFRRECERENWIERQELFKRPMGRGYGCHVFPDRDNLDDILPRRDYYEESKTTVRVRYAVDRQVYEGETVLSCTSYECRAGKNIYLTIDPARPDEILEASRYRRWSPGDSILIYGMLALMLLFSVVLLLLCRYQV